MCNSEKVPRLLLIAAFAVTACEGPPVTSPPPEFDVASAECNTGDCGTGVVSTSAVAASASTPITEAGIASITSVSNPTAAYVAATTLIDISGIPNFTSVGSITDGLQTVTFSTGMNKRHAEVSGWATWGDPPFTEIFAPRVLWTLGARSLDMTLSLATPTFGFELEPNPFQTISFTADFYSNGGTVLEGSITRSVAGFHGARLFAATSTGSPIDSVVVSGGSDFAIGRVRYTPKINVDIDIKPGSDPNSINCGSTQAVITVAILTTPDFDATTVDHASVTFQGAAETHVDRRTGAPRRHEEDVDGDGDIDLVFHFRQGDTDLACSSLEGVLSGNTFDGQPIEGSDAVRMVGDNEM